MDAKPLGQPLQLLDERLIGRTRLQLTQAVEHEPPAQLLQYHHHHPRNPSSHQPRQRRFERRGKPLAPRLSNRFESE